MSQEVAPALSETEAFSAALLILGLESQWILGFNVLLTLYPLTRSLLQNSGNMHSWVKDLESVMQLRPGIDSSDVCVPFVLIECLTLLGDARRQV